MWILFGNNTFQPNKNCRFYFLEFVREDKMKNVYINIIKYKTKRMYISRRNKKCEIERERKERDENFFISFYFILHVSVLL